MWWEYCVFGGGILLIGLGLYLTRGAGGVPGGLDDPARNRLAEYTPLGDHVIGAEGGLEQEKEEVQER